MEDSASFESTSGEIFKLGGGGELASRFNHSDTHSQKPNRDQVTPRTIIHRFGPFHLLSHYLGHGIRRRFTTRNGRRFRTGAEMTSS